MKTSYLTHHLGSLKKLEVILKLNELPKTKTHPSTYQEKLRNLLEHHPNHLYVFTDGSKDNNKTACAAVLNETILKKALPMESSIFTAEVFAIDQALDKILKSKQEIYHILSLVLGLTTIK